MKALKEPKNLLETAYFVKGTIGNVGMPGAPIVHFSLVISSNQDIVSGIVEIRQAIDRPSIKLNVAGTIRYTEYVNITKIINLQGEYTISETPPRIGSYLQKFTAYVDVDDHWNGKGGFSFSDQVIHNVKVEAVN